MMECQTRVVIRRLGRQLRLYLPEIPTKDNRVIMSSYVQNCIAAKSYCEFPLSCACKLLADVVDSLFIGCIRLLP